MEKDEEENEGSDGEYASFRDPDVNIHDQSLDTHKVGELSDWNDPNVVQEPGQLPGFRGRNGKLKDLFPPAVIGRIPSMAKIA